MCALVLLLRHLEGFPLVVGADRDESYDRPASPPGLRIAGERRALAPSDRRAGGTWIGFNDRGLFAAVTNRPGDADPSRPSRGELVPLALSASTAAGALARIAGRIENPFRLVVADASEAFLVSDEAPEPIRIAAGVHLLTNEHGLDAVSVPVLDRIRAARRREEAEPLLAALLADHTAHGGTHRFCKHAEGRGTVSSSRIAIPETGIAGAQFLYAPGPPCVTALRDYSNLVARLVSDAE